MKKVKWFSLILFSLPAFAGWENVNVPLSAGGDNAIIERYGNDFRITSHTNNECINSLETLCRKGVITYTRNKYDESKVRKHSFVLNVESYNTFPDFLIIYQDWVKIWEDDPDGNRPITSLKLKLINNELYLQQWNNAWQWSDVSRETHLTVGRETMNGEIKVSPNTDYEITVYTQDLAGTGRTFVTVNGVKISDSLYQASHLTAKHTVMTGMYWSKGYNLSNSASDSLIINFNDIKHEVLRYD